MSVQQINLNEFDLQDSTETKIVGAFNPFLAQLQQYQDVAASLVVTDESQTELMAQAREGRLALRSIRIEADRVRKDLKRDSIDYGRAVQSAYKTIEELIKPAEEHLLAQEKYIELKRKAEIDRLQSKRLSQVSDLLEYIPVNTKFGEMTEDDFNKLVRGAQMQKKADMDAQEAERLEFERRQQLESEKRKEQEAELERLRLENKKLKSASGHANDYEPAASPQKIEDDLISKENIDSDLVVCDQIIDALDRISQVPDMKIPFCVEAYSRISHTVVKALRMTYALKDDLNNVAQSKTNQE